jgi:hypothetical protein
MHLGVVAGRDVVAVPEPPRGCLREPGQGAGDRPAAPGAVLSEGFQGLPVLGTFDGQDGLGDGVLFDVQGQGGDPLGKVPMASLGKGPCEGWNRTGANDYAAFRGFLASLRR